MKKLNLAQKAVIAFNLLYIIPFVIYYLSIKDYEFLWYVAVLVILFVLVLSTLHKSKFDLSVLWGLSIWGLLHMAGGGIPVGDTVLYGLHLIPIIDRGGEFFILKFDQLVHAFGFAVSTLIVYQLLRPQLKEKFRPGVIIFVAILGGMGLGVVNEIVEFLAVVTFPETGVGGYYNTALDLVFNTIGALLAGIYIRYKYLAK